MDTFLLRKLNDCDVLVAGGNTAAMACALRESRRGCQVLLISAATCLYEEIFSAGDLRAPAVSDSEWRERLFPADCVDQDTGYLHPDRLKKHGERLMRQSGVRLLYAAQIVGWSADTALFATKSGLYSVGFSRLYDCRGLVPGCPDSYMLHTLRDGKHRMMNVPVSHTGCTAQERYLRYEQALSAMRPGSIVARGGTEPAYSGGFPVEDAVRAGMSAMPALPSVSGDLMTGLTACLAEETCDVLVVGGGTAGASAALFSARQGKKTVLLEMNRQLGGSATVGGVSTYWFGLRTGATAIIDEAVAACRRKYHQPARAGLWNENDHFSPDLKAHALLGLCLKARVDVRFGCIACGVVCDQRRLTGVYYAQNGVLHLIRAGMTIDGTGDGDICVMAGAGSVYGSETDGLTYWASLAQYPTPDSYRNNFSTMVREDDPEDYTRFIVTGRTLGREMYDHGAYVAMRESRHIKGLDTVTLENLLLRTPVCDPLYTCFSNYDPKGRLTSELCYFGLLPPNQLFVIPRGAVIPADPEGNMISGLLIGGKAISCTHDAFPGIRMQADLQNQGLALAALAGCAMEQGTDCTQATGVEQRIRDLGGCADFPDEPVRAPLADVVAALDGSEAWEWLDAPVTACESEIQPLIRILLADSREAVPLLRARYAQADTPALRLQLARLLLWHRDEVGAGEIVSAVRRMLDEAKPGLPRRAGSVNYGQLLPDHGLMPEAVYLINALAYAPGTDIYPLMAEIQERLQSGGRDWADLRAGIYCWCECFGWVAQRRHDLSLAPLIRKILALPELRHPPEDPLLNERLHMLALGLWHALHTLGCQDGTDGLRQSLNDPRAALRHAAAQLLSARTEA